MRIHHITLVLFVFSTLCHAQQKNGEDGYFVALYTIGESWDTEKSPNDQTYFKEHSAHLSSLRADSIIVVGGRYSETGMLVIQAENHSEAEKLLLNDVAVKNQLFQVEIHPLRPFYRGCLE